MVSPVKKTNNIIKTITIDLVLVDKPTEKDKSKLIENYIEKIIYANR